ncbi:hypothetical protein FE661_03180 [Acidithiobacillus ferrooxidans]|nr:hypothetical protein [Acidithiobacillus ferrooxidans]QLK41275.1 hypothetical protein FE661_03180 [Acidithiobacillus ferrooxidans]
MTNVHPFPKRRAAPKSAKHHTPRPDHGTPFYLPSTNGEKVDVLITVIAGCNVFLAADLASEEDEPTGNFYRALDGYETMLLAADTLIQFGMTEGAIDLGNKAGRLADWCEQTRKLLIKTHQAIPDSETIMMADDTVPDFQAEYLTGVAYLAAITLALNMLDFYQYFIVSGKDKRKAMFQDFRGAIQEAGDGIRSHVRHAGIAAHEIDLMHKKVRALLEDR